MKSKQTITRAMIVAATLAGMTCLAQSEAVPNVEVSEVRPSLEVEVRILQFNRKMIEAISRTNTINQHVIVSLFKSGEGELVAAPVVRTSSGLEATVRGVVEYIYPTSFLDLGTNISVAAQGNFTNAVSEEVIVPQDFSTREVGTVLTVLPELSPNGRAVTLTLTPQCVFEPVWRSYGYKNCPPKLPVPMEQPFFPVFSVSSSISVPLNSSVLIGGGIPNADGTKMVYILATVRRSTAFIK